MCELAVQRDAGLIPSRICRYSLYYGGEKRDGTATLTPALGTNIYCGHGTMIGGPAIDRDASRDALHVLAAEHGLASLRVAAKRASKEAR